MELGLVNISVELSKFFSFLSIPNKGHLHAACHYVVIDTQAQLSSCFESFSTSHCLLTVKVQ